jgi:thiamine-phosphate pyrophosphorylase
MSGNCILYYITDRTAFCGDERARRARLLDKIAEAVANGVDYIQLREKDLTIRELETLAHEAMRIIRQQSEPTTALLVNSRTDVALAANAGGVHLPANDVSPKDVRTVWKFGVAVREPITSVSCHSAEKVNQAAEDGANLAIFAPVFEKRDAPDATPQGLSALRQATAVDIPVLALGGITLQNADACLRDGGAGIAAIRLFQENEIAIVVRTLRGAKSIV